MLKVTSGIQLTENFSSGEFAMAGVAEFPLSMVLVNKLQRLRDVIDKPIHVASGYRSPEYNTAIGGADNSYHMKGMAADIKVQGMTVQELAKIAESIGFSGIGVYSNNGNNFVHVDVRAGKSYWVDSPGKNLVSVKKLPGDDIEIKNIPITVPAGASMYIIAGAVIVAGILMLGGDKK